MKEFRKIPAIALLALSVAFGGCSDSDDKGGGNEPTPTEEAINEIVKGLENDKDISIFTSALKNAGITGNEEEFTIFAVTNSGLQGQTREAASSSPDANLVKRHMVAGSYTEEQLGKLTTLTSLSGEKLRVTVDEQTGIIHINNVVIGSYKKVGNSAVYTIDEILPEIKGVETFYRMVSIDIPDGKTAPNPGGRSSSDEERPLWEFFYNAQGAVLKIVYAPSGRDISTYTFNRNTEGEATAMYSQRGDEARKRLFTYTYDQGRIVKITESAETYAEYKWDGEKLVTAVVYEGDERMGYNYEYSTNGNIDHYYINHYEGYTDSPDRKGELRYTYDSRPNFLNTIPVEWLLLTFTLDDMYFAFDINEYLSCANNVTRGSYYYINSMYKEARGTETTYKFGSDHPYPTWINCSEWNSGIDGHDLSYRKFVR